MASKRGVAYQCLECGKVEQRRHIKTHVYKCHLEKGNIPYFCSLCNFFGDSLQELNYHLANQEHKTATMQFGGNFNNDAFVNIAGNQAVYLQEGKHYEALSKESSEREWEKRSKQQRIVTAAPAANNKTPTLTCTVEREIDQKRTVVLEP